MNTLTEILIKNNHYFSQSGNIKSTDKELKHRYCSLLYDELFKEYKNKSLTILEVGIYYGGSLMLWSDYFINSKIIGVDRINQLHTTEITKYNRIHTYFTNAYKKEFVDSLDTIDIFIDDGSHRLQDQLSAIDLFLDKINPGGLFIIEDIQSIENANILLDKIKNMNYILHDSTKETKISDNIVLIIKK